MKTRSQVNFVLTTFVSQLEPKTVDQACLDSSWILAMQEGSNQFERNQVWELVPKPSDNSIIGIKWIFRNKTNEEGQVVRNKARLVAQGYDWSPQKAPIGSWVGRESNQ